jgi:alanyl-tRNA synthetase
VSIEELPRSIERLQVETKEQRRLLQKLQVDLAAYRAGELVAKAGATPNGRLVAKAMDADAAGLKALASAITTHAGVLAVLVSTSSPALVVVARAEDLSLRADELLAGLTKMFGGRGGGKPDLAQGSISAPADDILARARLMIESA